MQNREENTAPEPSGCNCEAQIADILARLEKLESEALTMEKLTSELPRSSLIEMMAKP